jgi:hypothetical protein
VRFQLFELLAIGRDSGTTSETNPHMEDIFKQEPLDYLAKQAEQQSEHPNCFRKPASGSSCILCAVVEGL